MALTYLGKRSFTAVATAYCSTRDFKSARLFSAPRTGDALSVCRAEGGAAGIRDEGAQG